MSSSRIESHTHRDGFNDLSPLSNKKKKITPEKCPFSDDDVESLSTVDMPKEFSLRCNTIVDNTYYEIIYKKLSIFIVRKRNKRSTRIRRPVRPHGSQCLKSAPAHTHTRRPRYVSSRESRRNNDENKKKHLFVRRTQTCRLPAHPRRRI